MKKFFKFQILFALAALLLASCSNDDPKPEYPSLKGDFLICEGGFGKNNGAIGFYSEEVSDNNIFKSVNSRDLGDVVTDFEVIDTLGFIVVNNSQKVEVVRMRDFKSVETIDDQQLTYPRFVKKATENTVYISNGSMDGEVLIYDFKQFELVGKIAVGQGPEMMVKIGSKMYVANSGGWGSDNTISVIDINTSKVISTIEVGVGTTVLKADAQNHLWAFSRGAYDASWSLSDAKIYKISTKTDAVLKSFDIPATLTTFGTNLLAVSSNGSVYYISDAVYKMDVDADALPTEKWLDQALYGIEVNTDNGKVYGMDANNNKVLIMDDADASIVSSYTSTAAYPSSVYFNN
jgi:YVTN family beta-propeller protein